VSSASMHTQEVAQVMMPAQVKDDLEKLREQLTQTLSSQIASHAVALGVGRDGLVISLREAGFFDSGSATPKPQSLPTLRTIGGKLRETPYDLRVEGHTDNVPIHDSAFESNWELSSLRATSIARLFIEMKAIEPERVSAAGYAEYHPVASNDTEEGRAQNRRVDLVVLPRINLNFAAAQGSRQPSDWKRITDEDQSGALP
jgi:chemotaxis protein MotB